MRRRCGRAPSPDHFHAGGVHAGTGAHQQQSGTTGFSGCEKKTNSFEIIDERETSLGSTSTPFEVLPMYIGNAYNEADITNFLQRNIYTNYKSGGLKSVAGQEWQDVSVVMITEESGGGKIDAHYYPNRHKIVAWKLGQYRHYSDPNTSDQPNYEEQMIASFKFN